MLLFYLTDISHNTLNMLGIKRKKKNCKKSVGYNDKYYYYLLQPIGFNHYTNVIRACVHCVVIIAYELDDLKL